MDTLINDSLLKDTKTTTQYLPNNESLGVSPISPKQKNRYSKSDLINCAEGRLFGPGNAQLPSGPLQLINEITDIQESGGDFQKGYARARIDVEPDSWYFKHHFKNDPVFPGCLMLESMWQLTGFHLAWSNLPGRGRLIDSGSSRFHVAVTNRRQSLELEIHIKKLIQKPGVVGVACGSVFADGQLVCATKNLKIALVSSY